MIIIKKFSLKLIIPVILVMIVALTSQATACVGGRPLGMGGAYIGVADDLNTLYWNPAGLIHSPSGLTYSPTLTERDEMGYRHFAGGVYNTSQWSAGLSYIQRERPWDQIREDWTVFSGAMELPMMEGSSVGVNLRYKSDGEGEDDFQQDLALHYQWDRDTRVGLMYQSLSNMRMGLSHYFADDMLLALDVYDLFDNQRFMFGIEYNIDEQITARMGSYNQDLTLGVGYRGEEVLENVELDAVVMFRDSNIFKLSLSYILD